MSVFQLSCLKSFPCHIFNKASAVPDNTRPITYNSLMNYLMTVKSTLNFYKISETNSFIDTYLLRSLNNPQWKYVVTRKL